MVIVISMISRESLDQLSKQYKLLQYKVSKQYKLLLVKFITHYSLVLVIHFPKLRVLSQSLYIFSTTSVHIIEYTCLIRCKSL